MTAFLPGDQHTECQKFGPGWRLLYLFALAAGMLNCFWPTISSGFAQMQADPGDTVLNHYFLEHSWRWLSDGSYTASFWSPKFFYPAARPLTYSESLIGTAPLYWGLRVVGTDEIAYQWWILLTGAMNYVAIVVVLRWFGINPILAALGGYLFAFGLTRQVYINHQQLMPHAFAPFVVWYSWRLVKCPCRRAWFLFLLLSAWQLLASIHLGWFLLFSLGICFAVTVLFDRMSFGRFLAFVRDDHWFVIGTTTLWLGGLALFFQNYYVGNASARREYSECLFFMPRWQAWFTGPRHSFWEYSLTGGEFAANDEQNLFMGIGFDLLLLVGIFGSAAWRGRADCRAPSAFALSCGITGLVLIFLTLYLGSGYSCWKLVYRFIPGANSIRAIGRISLTVLLLGTIGGLIACELLLRRARLSRRSQLIFSAILLLICGAEQFRSRQEAFSRGDFYPKTARLALEMTDADAVFVGPYRPGSRRHAEIQVAIMWAGFKANVPVINGYSGRIPDGYDVVEDDTHLGAIKFLGAAWQGRLLVIDRDRRQERRYEVRPGTAPEARIKLLNVKAREPLLD